MSILVLHKNPWQLYESERGWKACSKRLDAAFDRATAKMMKVISKGADARAALEMAFADVAAVMGKPENVEFGAADSEPYGTLATKLNRFMADRSIPLHVSRYGDAYKE
jgi:hypothetical protein